MWLSISLYDTRNKCHFISSDVNFLKFQYKVASIIENSSLLLLSLPFKVFITKARHPKGIYRILSHTFMASRTKKLVIVFLERAK